MTKSYRKVRFAFLLCLFFLLFKEQALPNTSLKFLAEHRGIEIRTVVNEGAMITDPEYVKMLISQFNSLTPELSLLFKNIHPARDTYNFELIDSIVNFAEVHDMKVHGHSLIYYYALPNWLTEGTWTRDELISILRDHIFTVVGRYKGRIKSWDVVNEAVPFFGTLGNDILTKVIGPEHVEMAFRWANEADPNARLFYKDFGFNGQFKGDRIYNLVSSLVERDVPIHGVSIQIHQPVFLTNLDGYAQNINRLSNLGLEVNIAELEVIILLPATTRVLINQAYMYRSFLQLFLRNKSSKVFEIMGFTDRYSWIPSFTFNFFGASLIFDENYIPKPAFHILIYELSALFYDPNLGPTQSDTTSVKR